MTEGSLNVPRPATCSVLLWPLCQQVHRMRLPEIQPSKHKAPAVTAAFGRLMGECEGRRRKILVCSARFHQIPSSSTERCFKAYISLSQPLHAPPNLCPWCAC